MIKEKVQSESREEKFVRIAESRTQKILNYIRLLGNCSNKNSYLYTDDQVRKIFRTIEKEMELTKERFKEDKNKSFKL